MNMDKYNDVLALVAAASAEARVDREPFHRCVQAQHQDGSFLFLTGAYLWEPPEVAQAQKTWEAEYDALGDLFPEGGCDSAAEAALEHALGKLGDSPRHRFRFLCIIAEHIGPIVLHRDDLVMWREFERP